MEELKASSELSALVEQWRAEIRERAGQGCGCYGRSTQLRICADQLAALLASEHTARTPDTVRSDEY